MPAQPSVQAVTVMRASLPLDRAYPVAMATITNLDAILAKIEADDGSVGWGEVTIIPGYTHETVESGLALCLAQAPRLLRKRVMQGKRQLLPYVATEPHAVSALMTALEMLERHPLLVPDKTQRIEVLAPVRGLETTKIPEEVVSLIDKGHRTLKVKVGFKSVEEDLARLRMIANAAAGAAKLRVDANQGYTKEQGSRFAQELDPAVVELFEQPCNKHDWDSNAAVAAVSNVPVMLDESVYNFADIQRAAGIEGVGYIKIEMEKFGGVEMAKTGLEMIRACGMIPVAGNGAASDISSWMEACTARLTVDVPCEMHGFLKLRTPLLEDRLPFLDGAIVLAPGYFPRVDEGAVERCATFTQRFE
jgi:L-alanine-DL-glutamate epimerase-like enolase superfamily enzyme